MLMMVNAECVARLVLIFLAFAWVLCTVVPFSSGTKSWMKRKRARNDETTMITFRSENLLTNFTGLIKLLSHSRICMRGCGSNFWFWKNLISPYCHVFFVFVPLSVSALHFNLLQSTSLRILLLTKICKAQNHCVISKLSRMMQPHRYRHTHTHIVPLNNQQKWMSRQDSSNFSHFNFTNN